MLRAFQVTAIVGWGAIGACSPASNRDAAAVDTAARDSAATVANRADTAGAPAGECYRTTESVLARRPGTAADGPPGLTGWIRLESGMPSDSGAARLTDSDRRSLDGRWRRLAADSIAVVAFDDFLRVEMRLATADPMSGPARATSDAALTRDSTGKMSGFRRDWVVTAQRAACADMPAPATR